VWYKVQSTGYRVQGIKYKVLSTGYKVQGTEYRVQGTGYKVLGNQGIKLNNFDTLKSVKICLIRQICVQFCFLYFVKE